MLKVLILTARWHFENGVLLKKKTLEKARDESGASTREQALAIVQWPRKADRGLSAGQSSNVILFIVKN